MDFARELMSRGRFCSSIGVKRFRAISKFVLLWHQLLSISDAKCISK